jgi:predicted nucleic acid-binding protein
MSKTPNSPVIVNTSPLLYLHQIGYLELLQNLYKKIIVPSAVVEELTVGETQGINVPDIEAIEWISITAVKSANLIPTKINLGKGEAEVLALGLANPDSLLIFDDRLARRFADSHQLKYTGTLGILVKAKHLGYLSSVAGVVELLRHQGMWLTDNLIEDVLRLAGET